MKAREFSASTRVRLLIAAALAVTALALFLLDQSATPTLRERAVSVKGDLGAIDRAVEGLFVRHGIRKEWIKTWQVRTPDRAFLRTERRVYVPPSFISVKFNRDLVALLEPLGATAVATERRSEQTVTMHIKQSGTIIESIAFVVNRDLESEGKESNH